MDEAVAQMTSANITKLWNGSLASVEDRIRPSGFMPTSVSGGYGGITEQFVRDSAGQLIGLLQTGKDALYVAVWPDPDQFGARGTAVCASVGTSRYRAASSPCCA